MGESGRMIHVVGKGSWEEREIGNFEMKLVRVR